MILGENRLRDPDLSRWTGSEERVFVTLAVMMFTFNSQTLNVMHSDPPVCIQSFLALLNRSGIRDYQTDEVFCL